MPQMAKKGPRLSSRVMQGTQMSHSGITDIVSSPLDRRFQIWAFSPDQLRRYPNLWLLVLFSAMGNLVIVVLLVKSWVASHMPFLLLTSFAITSGLSAYLDYCFILRIFKLQRQYDGQIFQRLLNRMMLFLLWIHAALTGISLFVVGLPLVGYVLLFPFYF